jgi:hypothetical protein
MYRAGKPGKSRLSARIPTAALASTSGVIPRLSDNRGFNERLGLDFRRDSDCEISQPLG